MHILVISHKYPPSIGGMQKHCFELVRGLERTNDIIGLIFRSNYPKIFFLLTIIPRSLWKLWTRKIDAVYVNDGLMALMVTPLLWLTKVPIFVTVHGLDVVFQMGFYQRWVRRYLGRFAGIIAVSEGTREECLTRGILPEKVVCIKNGFEPEIRSLNGVDCDKLDNKWNPGLGNRKVLVSVGRPIERKGFSWFIRQVLPQLGQDVVYVIIGPKPTKSFFLESLKEILSKKLFQKVILSIGIETDEYVIRDAVEQLGLHDRVIRTGKVSNDELTYLLNRASLYVMPNVRVEGDFEGFGLVALEAAVHGALVVASGIEGITSAIDHQKNGYLLESGDAARWTSFITEKLRDTAALKEESKTFQEYTLSHVQNWQSMSDQYQQFFQNRISEKG